MELHIGHLIKEKLEKSGMKKSEFARRINKTSQNVYDIFERKTIDTGLLAHISEVLGFNFFELLSNRFGMANQEVSMMNESVPGYYSSKELILTLNNKEQALHNCAQEVKQLQKEINYLLEINNLLRER